MRVGLGTRREQRVRGLGLGWSLSAHFARLPLEFRASGEGAV